MDSARGESQSCVRPTALLTRCHYARSVVRLHVAFVLGVHDVSGFQAGN